MSFDEKRPNIEIDSISAGPAIEGEVSAKSIVLNSSVGKIECLYHTVSTKQHAVVWVWGYAGGYGGPADNLYQSMGEDLVSEGIASLRVHYREPGNLEEAILDTIAAAQFLSDEGYTNIALVGLSFGGAVVISAAPQAPNVIAVIGLASQTYGATGAAAIAPRKLLLVHGTNDQRLNCYCSEQIYLWAQKPKELVLYPGAGHGLREVKTELRQLLHGWLKNNLIT